MIEIEKIKQDLRDKARKIQFKLFNKENFEKNIEKINQNISEYMSKLEESRFISDNILLKKFHF